MNQDTAEQPEIEEEIETEEDEPETPDILGIEDDDKRHFLSVEVTRFERDQLEEEVFPEIIEFREDVMGDEDEGTDEFTQNIAPEVLENAPGEVDLRLGHWEGLVALMTLPRIRENVGKNRIDYLKSKLTRRLMRAEYERED